MKGTGWDRGSRDSQPPTSPPQLAMRFWGRHSTGWSVLGTPSGSDGHDTHPFPQHPGMSHSDAEPPLSD